MRHIALLLALSASFAVSAAPTATKEMIEKCAGISKLAEAVMTKRQDGVAMSDLMKAASDGAEPDQLLVRMVTAAYEQTRFQTPENKRRKVEDFRDQFYLGCIKQSQD